MIALPWITANAAGYLRFRGALDDPEAVQRAILRRYLRENVETAFGRQFRFGEIRGVEEFQARIPLATYADFAPWIDRIGTGERNVLTQSQVRTLELTGGSTTAAKRIPYTAAMQREIRRAVAPWVFDLYKDRPRLALGCAYWSITPLALEEERGDAPVKVGFEEDSAYLGGFWKRLVDSTLAVPASVRFARDVDAFRFATLRHLLRRRDLTVISVWHPSFLTLLMAALSRFWERLLREIEPGRAAELRCLGPDALTRIWPRLGLISCWGDGHAALHLEEVRRAFPGVEIQPKGLLATEAFVTIPFAGAWPVAVRSHFFEFLDERRPGERPRLAHQLEPGGVYSVVVTTGGGLYRYRLEDRVEVTGFVRRTPSLRFLGKEGHVSDLRGEKLHESFVAGALERTFRRLGIRPRFAMLAPEGDALPGYVLYLEAVPPGPPDLAAVLEAELSANPQYRACVALGQLAPVKVFLIDKDAFSVYLRRCQDRGQRIGDVKPLALSPLSGWSTLFG
jgi:GH3 auxin-responsive promoter